MALPKLKTIVDELKVPALIMAGIMGGNLAGKLIDRFVPIDETAEGFQAKSLIKPVALIGAGVAGAILVKNPTVKLISTGVVISGISSGVKTVLKKDVLSGLGDSGDSVRSARREPLNLSIEAYRPDLPKLPEYAASQPADPDLDGIAGDEDFQEAEIL